MKIPPAVRITQASCWFVGWLLCGGAISAEIVNGSFEDPAVGAFYQVLGPESRLPGWTIESGALKVVGAYWIAAGGAQSVDLSGVANQPAVIFQDVATAPGQSYKVRFAFAGNPEDGATSKQMQVFWGTDSLATLEINTADRSPTTMGWQYYDYTVTASGSTSRLKFQSLTQTAFGPSIDDVSVTAEPAAQILNGSFESPPVGPQWQVFFPGNDIPGWTVESGTVEVVGAYWAAAADSQSLDLSGIFDLAGTIYQDVATTPGKYYKIRFALAGNPDDAAVKRMKVFWGANPVATLEVDTTGRSALDMGWRYYEFTVSASDTVSRLKFQSLTLNPLGPVIDDVAVSETAPPEGPALELNVYAGLTISGTVGATYRIEAASLLNTNQWLALTNVQLTTSPYLWIDIPSTNSQKKFYRAVLVP